MILALNIKDKNNGSWLLIEDAKEKNSKSFIIDRDNDKVFISLDKLLLTNKLELVDLEGLILYIQDAGLTQVKIFTAIINTFAWQLGISVIGKYYCKNSLSIELEELLNKLKQENKKSLEVEYRQNPDISLSKKVPKYVIKN